MTVAPVEQQEIVEWDEFTGRTEPVESVEVRPRVSGYIQEVRFQSGQLVKKGDVLFVIDPRWHQAEFDRCQADVDRARVQLENAKREADRTLSFWRTKRFRPKKPTRELRGSGSQSRSARSRSGSRFRETRSGIHAGARADRWSRQPRAVDGRQLCQRRRRSDHAADDDRFGGPGLCLCGC